MSWSTRELAELAGTSLRSVRHYHEVGLLEEPERGSNGYKHYGPRHLVRLLTIRRLVDLGLSLAEVADLDGSHEHAATALRRLDAQHAESIDRLRRARLELAVLMDQPVPSPGLPAELAPVADQPLSDADRAYLVVLSRVVRPELLQAYLETARAAYAEPTFARFSALPPDAGEVEIGALVDDMLPLTLRMRAQQPVLRDLTRDAELGPRRAARAVTQATRELYNPAQCEVLERIRERTVAADREASAGA